VVVSAFQTALLHQGLVVLTIAAVVGLSWNVLRSLQLRRLTEDKAAQARSSFIPSPEPAARRFLRISFGLIWIFDGVLQGQASMPLGLVPKGIQPSAAASPLWVQHIVNFGTRIWNYHPVTAATAVVWIQIGIGVWLLLAPRGTWSRLAGLTSAGWGIVVWIFGEAFGGIFAPGLSWLLGAPGAVLFYCVAGVLVALPERHWVSARLGQRVLRGVGIFFLGMALLQGWPGRGFWQGRTGNGSTPGLLAAKIQQTAQALQPHFFSSLVMSFANFDAVHGWAVNLFVVVVLALIGFALISARPQILRIGVLVGIVACLADWIFVADLGFLGGTGTDPSSMIPMALIFIAGYVAITRLPVVDGETVISISTSRILRSTWQERFWTSPTYAFRLIGGIGAVGITLLGVVPMAAAATNPNADPILSQSISGTPIVADSPAPSFDLLDQNGRHVSLASLHGKAIALTFLDPVCTSDCPIIAQEFRAADGMLGQKAKDVVLVAIDANPTYIQRDVLVAFDRQEGLEKVFNWLYLTGSLKQLEHLWDAYGCGVQTEPGGAMVSHSDLAYVIDVTGRSRYVLNADPGPGSAATQSSFAVLLSDALSSALENP
jgi:cytochrome oxidase Cu insertion factor (SCO1/SenC/PrrC family)